MPPLDDLKAYLDGLVARFEQPAFIQDDPIAFPELMRIDLYFTRVVYVLTYPGIMAKKLTITLDEAVYEGLYRVVGPRRISRFIEQLVRPHVIDEDLEAAYAEMAQDEERETEALEWSEALISDVSDEAR